MIRYSLVLFAGAISVLAYSPFALWWMSIVSFSLLYTQIPPGKCSSAFSTGFIYGVGMFGFGVSWFFHSIHDYGQAHFAIAILATIVLTLVFSIFPGLAVWLYNKLLSEKSYALARMSLFVSAWVLIEWLRSWIFTGFPWLLFGHTLVDSPLAGIIPVFGSYGGSAVIAFIAVGIIELVRAGSSKLIGGIFYIIIFIAVIFALQFIQWTSSVGEKNIRASLVQANIPFEMKWDPDRRGEIYEIYVKETFKYHNSDIVVWPETAIPTYYSLVNEEFLDDLKKEINKQSTEILSGVFTYRYEQDEARLFNSLVTIGGETQFYHKQHLVPFGEYWPFRWLSGFLRNFVDIPMSDLVAGEGEPIVMMQGIPVGVSICYEAAFGEEIIRALPRAQLLVNVSNDAWFGDSLAPHQHLQIAQSRALETGRYMLRATNTGISAIIDPDGQVLVRSAQFVDEVVSGEVRPMQGKTPYIIWGNWGIISIMFVLILLASRNSFIIRQKSP